MEDIRYTFKVDTKKVKVVFILMFLFPFLVVSGSAIAGYILRGLPVFGFFFILFVFGGVFVLLWIYGKYAMFGLEWQLYDSGLRILKNGQEIRFIPWEDIASIQDARTIIDGRDNKRFAIALPPVIRKDMIEKMYELKERKITGDQNLRATYFSKEPRGVKGFLSAVCLEAIVLILFVMLLICHSFLLGILSVLFPGLHIRKDSWSGVTFLILFFVVFFCFLYFDIRKWCLLARLRTLFLGDNLPKWQSSRKTREEHSNKDK
jgi:hypothetical protein